MLPAPLRGIVVPLATPLSGSGTLDASGLERLIEHVLRGGVHGIFLLGTTGEGPSLSRRVRTDVVTRACSRIAGRVPVLVGITDTSFDDAVELAQSARDAGADAVVYAGPSYSPVSQAELLRHVTHLTERLPLPVFLYNMPANTGTHFERDTVRELASVPGVLGLKDSSGNLLYLQKLCLGMTDRPDFTLMVGPEELLSSAIAVGAHGGVNGGANLLPRLYVRLYEAATRRETDEQVALHRLVMQVSESIYTHGDGASSYLRGLKSALSHLGICDAGLAEPYSRFGHREHEAIGQALAKIQGEKEFAPFLPDANVRLIETV